MISINPEIMISMISFDDGYEVRGVFLDILKVFDKVWHNGLIYKLKQNGVSGNVLNLIIDFIILHGQVLNQEFPRHQFLVLFFS